MQKRFPIRLVLAREVKNILPPWF